MKEVIERFGKMKTWRFAVLFVSLLFSEIFFQLFIYQTFTWGMLFGTLFAIPTAFLGAFLSGFGPKWLNKVIFSLYLTVLTLFILIQYVYHMILNDQFLMLYSLVNGRGFENALDFVETIKLTILQHWWRLLVMALPMILYYALFLPKNRMHWERMDWKEALVVLGGGVLSHLLVLLVLILVGTDLNTPKYYYDFQSNQPMNFKNLGVVTSMRLDMQRMIFKNTRNNTWVIEDPVEESSKEESEMMQSEAREQMQKKSVPNVLDIDFDKLIANESNDTIRSLHEYMKSVEPTYTNEYTGIFKDYNLVLITAEGFSKWAVDPDLTPTLYKMVHEGFYFENFYQPLYYVSTSDGEFVTDTSILPQSDRWSYYRTSMIEMPFGMGNRLNPLGYTCFAYHNHTYDFYDRELSHPNMGYVYKGLYNGMDIKVEWPESDLDMIRASIDDYINCEPFHAYYMTVSGHLEYSYGGNSMSRRNWDKVADLPYPESVKAYLACNIELDLAMEYLLQKLEESGAADHTLIVLSQDHYPYGLTDDELTLLNDGVDVTENWGRFHTNLIMYTPSMREQVRVKKYCCSLDVIPTIYNLMGLEYDSRLFMGRDILSSCDGLVITNDYSFFNEKVSYNTQTGETVYKVDGVDEKYVNKMINRVNNSYAVSLAIVDNDYYSYLKDYMPWWDGVTKGRNFDPALDRLCTIPEE